MLWLKLHLPPIKTKHSDWYNPSPSPLSISEPSNKTKYSPHNPPLWTSGNNRLHIDWDNGYWLSAKHWKLKYLVLTNLGYFFLRFNRVCVPLSSISNDNKVSLIYRSKVKSTFSKIKRFSSPLMHLMSPYDTAVGQSHLSHRGLRGQPVRWMGSWKCLAVLIWIVD